MSAPASAASVRAVIFATGRARDDLPVAHDTPAALLPLGHAPLVSRLVEQLARVGVTEVAIVVGERPEALRRELGQGERWGVRLHWSFARLDERPYAVLRSPALGEAERVIVGHADGWVAPRAFDALREAPVVVYARDGAGGLAWTGWASVPAGALAAVAPDSDEAAFERVLAVACPRRLVLEPSEAFRPLDAAALLRASRAVIEGSPAAPLPAAWIPQPWGAVSPRATVHPRARVVGPALIGPGCLVDEGATVGPHAILGADVILSAGTTVRDSVVFPGSYLGRDLDLSSAIVNGARIRHVALGVETTLPASDAIALGLRAPRARRPSLAGRASAALGALLLAPLLAAAVLLRRQGERALPWSARPVVLGLDGGRSPVLGLLRCPREADSALRGAAALVGGLLDVAQGRRGWFGVRPRQPEEWQVLDAHWRALIASAPVGLLHAPAWTGESGSRLEALAVADAFHAVRRGWRENLRLAMAALRAAGRPRARGPLKAPSGAASGRRGKSRPGAAPLRG